MKRIISAIIVSVLLCGLLTSQVRAAQNEWSPARRAMIAVSAAVMGVTAHLLEKSCQKGLLSLQAGDIATLNQQLLYGALGSATAFLATSIINPSVNDRLILKQNGQISLAFGALLTASVGIGNRLFPVMQ